MKYSIDVEQILHKSFSKTTIGLSLAGVATLVLSGIFVKRKVKALEKLSPDQSLGLITINKKPPGLVNFGNTCFVNSVLQALASMPKFIKNLEELCQYDDVKETKDRNGNGKKDNKKINIIKKKKNKVLGIKEQSHLICKELLNILHVLNDENMGNEDFSFQPHNLINLLEETNDYLSFREQQDSHEVLKLIINCFEDTLKKGNYQKYDLVNISKKEFTLSNSLLGYMNTYLQCVACDRKFNNRIEAFYDLSLDILDRSISSLEDSIKHYFQEEYIDDVQCLNCSINVFLKEKENKVKYLTAQFQKNSDSNILACISKINEQIDYIKTVGNKSLIETEDVVGGITKMISEQIQGLKQEYKTQIQSPFCVLKRQIKKVQKISKTPQILILHLKRLVINPQTGYPIKIGDFIKFDEQLRLDQTLGLKKKENIQTYHLSSLISHLGSDNFGHYVTLRRVWHQNYQPYITEEVNKTQYTKSLWYLTSDREIRYIEKADVLKVRAYILFYEKMESE
ncbi:ubiquitin carboxy-terminal hydrolase (macronuclear) [Tetrahymena thermophila SB210]|uniref:Ubiquitin carboxyl-terminal hydrolase n=1 Tax=Tetrahymena thermophila (strain SB210) TaxID=312017 RepID=I7M9J4_TETTS|nr:ubiquitin carboxy-terminal hydrolase [Tetrahymena thermophila SB210]EAS01954.2 ubiquitin carboxy-terminal hydrolase [Tetrahymena thermophila SB210]|eukprot:XP_001022199.2 ubiquitin carboxy-terminal hydrolase [Tetrahymena thermophila SB210]